MPDSAAASSVTESGRPLAAVLAGGAGSRLGGRKESRLLAGRELIRYPLDALERAGVDRLVVAKPGLAVEVDCEVVAEPENPTHPLLGIVTALRRGGGRPVLIVACDMPFIEPRLLSWLAGLVGAPLALPAVGGTVQPLLARYEASLAGDLSLALDDEAGLIETVEALPRREVTEAEMRGFGDPVRMLMNVNTEEDLERADDLLRAGV